MAAPQLPISLAKALNDTKVSYTRVGSSGLRVSVPILGAMSLGSKQWAEWNIEEPEALPLLKAAYDRGLNTWYVVFPREAECSTLQYLFAALTS